MQAALLPDRGVVKVAGDDARNFLNGIATNDIAKVVPGRGRFAALLTPQGKIVVDFIAIEAGPQDGSGFLLDCPKTLAPALVEKLTFYRLRAKITIEDRSEALGVLAVWGKNAAKADVGQGLSTADPRLPALGLRIIVPPDLAAKTAAAIGATLSDSKAYDAHRIALGVPRGGEDFGYLETFPHEADMDQLHGVDFGKGCYIGQEVVSRVEHRSTARSRVVPVLYDGTAPAPGAPVMAGEKAVGTMGSSAQGQGLALLRLDRIADALAAKAPLTAGGIPVRAAKPAWATFDWPGEPKAAP
ncbi:MAG: folate-binding protein [Pseudolabrys sp.]|nr:folate-binding protein [Pseudolabrys sp.]